MRAKSLNDISSQRDRLKEIDKLLKIRDGYTRIETIIQATRNARAARGLSIFNPNKDEKR